MRKLISKDHQNRQLVKQEELTVFILKHILLNQNFPKTLRWKISYKTAQLKGNLSKTRLSNRCVKTVNKKTFHKFSNFSRIVFLRLAKLGHISGLRKASW